MVDIPPYCGWLTASWLTLVAFDPASCHEIGRCQGRIRNQLNLSCGMIRVSSRLAVHSLKWSFLHGSWVPIIYLDIRIGIIHLEQVLVHKFPTPVHYIFYKHFWNLWVGRPALGGAQSGAGCRGTPQASHLLGHCLGKPTSKWDWNQGQSLKLKQQWVVDHKLIELV